MTGVGKVCLNRHTFLEVLIDLRREMREAVVGVPVCDPILIVVLPLVLGGVRILCGPNHSVAHGTVYNF